MFSIIIPVFNGQRNLKRCIKSILTQTFSDYEIIIIDDGSTDQTWSIAKQIEQSIGNKITCIRIDRRGAGAARNTGLSYAKGEYILFIDADDYWIDRGLLKSLNEKISLHAIDVLMFQMLKITESGKVLEKYRKDPFFHDQVVLRLEDTYHDLVKSGQVLASCCNKCIRKDLLDRGHIRFLEDVYAEDIDWVIQLFSCVRTICLLNIDAYAYVQHNYNSRSKIKDAPNDIVRMIASWSDRLTAKRIPHSKAVAGLIAFEYGICMGNYHYLSKTNRELLRRYEFILKYGLDRKTRLIYKFYKLFGFNITCIAIRLYLYLRTR